MAEIRKIARRPELSAFQQVAPTGGSATLLALAETMQAAYERLRPAGLQQMENEAEAEWTGQARRDMGNPGGMVTASGGSIGGAPIADWLRYSNQGATRNDPLAPELVSAMSFLGDMGITMDVVSGGQEAAGTPGASRTGSTRHDHGQSADVDFYMGGRKLDWNNAGDLPVLQQVVSRAKASGITGIGAGDDYMGPGRFHVGFGAPAVWGAGGKGENAPQWLVEAYNGAPAGNVTMSTQSAPATIIQTADGSLQPRLYSPASGEFGQAYNAAASVVYRNEAELETSAALLDLSNQFTLDPDGYQQAAKAYIDETLKNVPDMFRGELRQVMQGQVQRRALGILEDRQADIRQRASNSNQALIDRHSTALSEALVTGNPDAIARAEADLRTQLTVRETLPGLSWTREQSENALADARDRAQNEAVKRQKEVADAYKEKANLALKGLREGLETADLGALMGDPVFAAMQPELRRSLDIAMVVKGLGLQARPPAERADIITQMSDPSRLISDADVDAVKELRQVDQEVTTAFLKSPMDAADKYLAVKPPQIPDFDLKNPKAFIAALIQSAEDGDAMVKGDYAPRLDYLRDADAERLGAMFSLDQPAQVRGAAVIAMAQALGPRAAQFFSEIKGDRASLSAGMLAANGGDTGAISEFFFGQQLVEEGTAPPVPSKSSLAALSPDVAAAVTNLPNGINAESQIMDIARPIYAALAKAQNVQDPESDEGQALMLEAVQKAAGRRVDGDRVTGGIHSIGGNMTWMPIGVSGAELDGALRSVFGPVITGTARSGSAPNVDMPDKSEVWRQAGAVFGAPMIGTGPSARPVTASDFKNGFVKLLPIEGGMYRMIATLGNQTSNIYPVNTPDGAQDVMPFYFNAKELIGAMQ